MNFDCEKNFRSYMMLLLFLTFVTIKNFSLNQNRVLERSIGTILYCKLMFYL